MAERFYAPAPWGAACVHLTGEEARHLAVVRRIREGERVELLDGEGVAWAASVARIGKGEVTLNLEEAITAPREAPARITLAAAFPKGDRIDWLVEKATEIGVDRLIPLRTERSVVDPRDSKLDRLRRTVVEASKQCGRARFMTIAPPLSFPDFLSTATDATRLIAQPGGRPAGTLPRLAPGGRVTLAVGPEGGFTESEVEAALELGWNPIGLGSTILRIETAALAGAWAIIMSVDTQGVDG